MSVLVTLDQITQLAPSARSSYRDAFAAGQGVLDQFEISATPLRVAHFMAQMMHESGGLTIQFENLNYSPERLPKVWPTRFQPKGPLDPAQFAHNAERLANEVYARAELGNTGPGDGFKYRGRGLLQLTGKASYGEATKILRQSFPMRRTSSPIQTRQSARTGASKWQPRNGHPKVAMPWPIRMRSGRSLRRSTEASLVWPSARSGRRRRSSSGTEKTLRCRKGTRRFSGSSSSRASSRARSRRTEHSGQCRTAQARPSGSTPTSMWPVTSSDFKSITAT